jgi:hypothetical protein
MVTQAEVLEDVAKLVHSLVVRLIALEARVKKLEGSLK